MKNLLLIQGSMVGHSFSPFYKYIESLNRELDTIHQVRLIVSYLHFYLANHGGPSHSCSPNLEIYLVVHNTPPGVCLSDTPLDVFIDLYIRQGCLSSRSLHRAIFPLTQSLPLTTIQRLRHKHFKKVRRKEKDRKRFRKTLHLVCATQLSVVVFCGFEGQNGY